MSGRSDFLVHWVGKHLHTEAECTKRSIRWERISAVQREKYVGLLADIVAKGICVTIGQPEYLFGKDVGIRQILARVCFTETRLSQAEHLSKQYGCLGVGVRRDWAIARGGAPVHYVGEDNGQFVANAFVEIVEALKHWEALKHCEEERVPDVPGDVSCLRTPTHVKDEVWRLAYFVRRMSDSSPNDYSLMEENEWRIVEPPDWVQPKPFTAPKEEEFVADGNVKVAYRIPILPHDVAIIVLPDERTRFMLYHHELITEWMGKEREKCPPFLTLEECRNL